jgi:hypothetical protein
MSVNINGVVLDGDSIIVARSPEGFDKSLLAAIEKRLPKGALLICLRGDQDLRVVDESVMNACGWFRKPRLIVPGGHTHRMRHD